MVKAPHRSLYRNWRLAGVETVDVSYRLPPMTDTELLYTNVLDNRYLANPKIAAYSTDAVDPTLFLTFFTQYSTVETFPSYGDWTDLVEMRPPPSYVQGGKTYYDVVVPNVARWARFAVQTRDDIIAAPLTIEVRANTWAARYYNDNIRAAINEKEPSEQITKLKYEGKYRVEVQ